MAWGLKYKKDKKRQGNRLGDVPGMVMLTIVLLYSVVMVVDGYLLCRSGLIKGPGYQCPDAGREIIYIESGEVLEVPESGGRTMSYVHDSLRLSFEYPSEWGDVTIREELGTAEDGRSDVIGLMLHLSDMSRQAGGLFLHANNPNVLVTDRRLNYWGSDAVKISSLFDLQGWCDGRADCEYFTNSNGVLVAKDRVSPGGIEGGASFDVYYLFNPNGGYNGVALSSERLSAKYGPANLQQGFKSLVDSIRISE